MDEVSRGPLSAEEESLRRGALSWACVAALLLMAWVLLSTSEPKASFADGSLVLCDRAGFCCALGTGTLATTSDVRLTTGDPLETTSASKGARSGPVLRHVNLYSEINMLNIEPAAAGAAATPSFLPPGKNCPKLAACVIASPECRLY